jgi:hypothetical protein
VGDQQRAVHDGRRRGGDRVTAWPPSLRLALAFGFSGCAYLLAVGSFHLPFPFDTLAVLPFFASMPLWLWLMTGLFNGEYRSDKVGLVTWIGIATGLALGIAESPFTEGDVVGSVLLALTIGGGTYLVATRVARTYVEREAMLPEPPRSQASQ